jgi:flagellar hook-basal body complex protein FliE
MGISALTNISSPYIQEAYSQYNQTTTSTDSSFDSVFQSALNMIDETNQLQNAAESEEIKFALGESDNTHDLAVAQEKANIALQYTVAVRDKVVDAYKEIMQMQM